MPLAGDEGEYNRDSLQLGRDFWLFFWAWEQSDFSQDIFKYVIGNVQYPYLWDSTYQDFYLEADKLPGTYLTNNQIIEFHIPYFQLLSEDSAQATDAGEVTGIGMPLDLGSGYFKYEKPIPGSLYDEYYFVSFDYNPQYIKLKQYITSVPIWKRYLGSLDLLSSVRYYRPYNSDKECINHYPPPNEEYCLSGEGDCGHSYAMDGSSAVWPFSVDTQIAFNVVNENNTLLARLISNSANHSSGFIYLQQIPTGYSTHHTPIYFTLVSIR